ncbi:MAG: hypothetical protein HQL33_11335 [Alphaproteobacteria bacterium]|nr:hypothetical protein [Alphaproteobacteria bacterium]MBF0130573.1 hypothetical protein [Alphaproteobacteria bacterium]
MAPTYGRQSAILVNIPPDLGTVTLRRVIPLGRACLLAALSCLAACAGSGGGGSGGRDLWEAGTHEIRIMVDRGANLDRPVAVDLVAVFDGPLLGRLQTMTARGWFSNRDQLRRESPHGFRSWEWEVVPGQMTAPLVRPDVSRPVRGFLLFADFATPGDHRLRLETLSGLVLHVKARDMAIEKISE